jgi:hypothetical protein
LTHNPGPTARLREETASLLVTFGCTKELGERDGDGCERFRRQE